MREAGDFTSVSGAVAFQNGIYTAYAEDYLYPALKPHTMVDLCVDIFELYDDEADQEIRAEEALSAQVKKYLEIGHFDEAGHFEPIPSRRDFYFPFEEEMQEVSDDDGDQILANALSEFMRPFALEDKLPEAVAQFAMRTHWYLSRFRGVYYADQDLIRQLKESVHFQLVPVAAVFLLFGNRVMMLSIGYDD